MAHYTITLTNPLGLKLALAVDKALSLKADMDQLKAIIDSATGGGVAANLREQAYLDLMGLPSADAGTASYAIVTAVLSGLSYANMSQLGQGKM